MAVMTIRNHRLNSELLKEIVFALKPIAKRAYSIGIFACLFFCLTLTLLKGASTIFCVHDVDLFVADNQLNLGTKRHSLLAPGHLISVQIFITDYIR